ncbi:MAG: hypothetical protein ACI87O_000815 [Planctomycetota bacterium]
MNQFGYFLVGHGGIGEVVPPGSAGKLCLLGGILGRYNQGAEVWHTGTSGLLSLTIDPTALRSSVGNLYASAGSTYKFQAADRNSKGVVWREGRGGEMSRWPTRGSIVGDPEK